MGSSTSDQIRIDRLAGEGEGVGRLVGGDAQGKVAFVPYVLPEELIQARQRQDKKHYSRTVPDKILEPSPHRVEPPCPVFFRPGMDQRWCGGCDWQHISPEEQVRLKEQLLAEALERLGGIRKPPLNPMVPSPKTWRYRNKVQVPVGHKKDELIFGFFAPASHHIVEFDDCLIQPELSGLVLRHIRQYARGHGWRAYDPDRGTGWLRHVLIRSNRAQQVFVILVTRDASFPGKNEFVSSLRTAFPSLVGFYQNIQAARTNVILGSHWIHMWGEKGIEETVAGLHLFSSPGSFLQVNTDAAELLYERALSGLDIGPQSLVVDLYCGIGCLALLAAKKAEFVIGVEVSSSAVRDAKYNAQSNHISNAEFLALDAAAFFYNERYTWLHEESDRLHVILDPPRGGCDPKLLSGLLRWAPKRVVYVSCNPATLARDLKILSSSYSLTSVTPVDLFPQTAHIESVSVLARRGA